MKVNRLLVQLFTKADCSLCVPVEEIILKVQEKIPFTLSYVDIENDMIIDVEATVEQNRWKEKEIRKLTALEPDLDILNHTNTLPWYAFAYHYHIPVVHINGMEISRHTLEEEKFIAALQQAENALSKE